MKSFNHWPLLITPCLIFLVSDLSRPAAKSKVIHYNRTKPFISDPSQPLQHIAPFHRHSPPLASHAIIYPTTSHTYIHSTVPSTSTTCTMHLPPPVHFPVGCDVCPLIFRTLSYNGHNSHIAMLTHCYCCCFCYLHANG